ncbi:MAG: FAD:protein FMN transferase [Anaerolineales bacterium]|jgi:thiamine biosynthesis lipoprotein
MEQIEFRAMGSKMMAALEVDGPQARESLSRVPAWFEIWEQHFSRFREDSELSELNRRAGEWVQVSAAMWEMLLTAREVERESGGLVTPALQGALAAYGYDRSFEWVAKVSANLEVKELDRKPLPGMQLQIDPYDRRVHLPLGTQLDFGGIAKGWSADQALAKLSSIGAGLVDAGGDVASGRPNAQDAAWPVGITDPFAPEDMVELLALRGEAVATSGRDVHRWLQNDAWRHHLIDPRTGEPAASRVLAATVIAPTAVEAEIGAKCALILGQVEGLAWLDARPQCSGLLIMEDGAVLESRDFDKYVWSD